MENSAKNVLRQLKHFAVDNLELLSGSRDRLTPPKRLSGFIGPGDFSRIGNEFFDYFVRLGHLQPSDMVLDIGSGIGRMAVPLTRFLDGRGGYEGFDISRTGVEWCNQNIHKRYKNFHFHHADIYNLFYNPNGKIAGHEYSFPFPDGRFDFVFLTSVFTHLLEDDVERYIAEIRRVLKPGARGLITFFLINDESLRLNVGGGDVKLVKYQRHMYVQDPQVPEAVTGYEEAWVRSQLSRNGISIEEPIHYGNWCGREQHVSYQDIIIVTKDR